MGLGTGKKKISKSTQPQVSGEIPEGDVREERSDDKSKKARDTAPQSEKYYSQKVSFAPKELYSSKKGGNDCQSQRPKRKKTFQKSTEKGVGVRVGIG